MNTGMHSSFEIIFSSSLGMKSGTAESCGSSIFHFLRNLCAVFHSGCAEWEKIFANDMSNKGLIIQNKELIQLSIKKTTQLK